MTRWIVLLLLVAVPAWGGQLCVQIPDDKEPEVVRAASAALGYQPQLITDATSPTPIPNPQTAKQFLKEQVRLFIVNNARQQLRTEAVRGAVTNAETTSDAAANDLVKDVQ